MNGFCPLASGSKGNCTYFGTKNTRVLIDAGISEKKINAYLTTLGVSLSDIDAILITHEHSDHIKGLETLALRYKIPIFANADTAKAIHDSFDKRHKFKIFSTGETFEFGDIEVHPFSIQHDTLDPVAFTIRTDNLKCGFCTDLGFVTTLVKNNLKECDYLYIEANHEPSMVHSSHRPQVYKQRVLSRQGHISNGECAQLLTDIFTPKLKHIHLAHLSQECNSPELALKIIQEKLLSHNFQTNVSIALQNALSHPILF